jgi:hypothetical protein
VIIQIGAKETMLLIMMYVAIALFLAVYIINTRYQLTDTYVNANMCMADMVIVQPHRLLEIYPITIDYFPSGRLNELIEDSTHIQLAMNSSVKSVKLHVVDRNVGINVYVHNMQVRSIDNPRENAKYTYTILARDLKSIISYMKDSACDLYFIICYNNVAPQPVAINNNSLVISEQQSVPKVTNPFQYILYFKEDLPLKTSVVSVQGGTSKDISVFRFGFFGSDGNSFCAAITWCDYDVNSPHSICGAESQSSFSFGLKQIDIDTLMIPSHITYDARFNCNVDASFVTYPNSGTKADYIRRITEIYKRYANHAKFSITYQDLLTIYPPYNFNTRPALDLALVGRDTDPSVLKAKYCVSSPNFALYFSDEPSDLVFRNILAGLIELEHFFIVLQIEHGFDFGLNELGAQTPKRYYDIQEWLTKYKNGLYAWRITRLGSGGVAGLGYSIVGDIEIALMAHEVFHHLQRAVPLMDLKASRNWDVTWEGTAEVGAAIALHGMFKGVQAIDTTARYNNLLTNMHENIQKSWQAYDKCALWISLIKRTPYIFGKSHCDITNNDESVIDRFVRLSGLRNIPDLFAIWLTDIMNAGLYPEAIYKKDADNYVGVLEWFGMTIVRCIDVMENPGTITISLTPDVQNYWKILVQQPNPNNASEQQVVTLTPNSGNNYVVQVGNPSQIMIGIAAATFDVVEQPSFTITSR